VPEKRIQTIDHETFMRLAHARDFLAENFAANVPLKRAADEAFFSPFHFQRLYRKAFQESPHEFVTRMRMEAAMKMLRNEQISVSEICLEVGYESLGTFSSRFARMHGCAPTEFRRIYSVPGLWALKCVPGCFRAHFR
jgi:AraC-like DNA-binding protein